MVGLAFRRQPDWGKLPGGSVRPQTQRHQLACPALPDLRQAHNRPSMPGASRLVGRAPELAQLQQQFRTAAAGEFRSVVLIGDAGIGKTRLAREFLARRRDRAITMPARAYQLGGTVSFGVWSEALEHHLRGLDANQVSEVCGGFLDDLAALIRSVAAVRGAPEREPPRLRLLEGLAIVVANLSSRLPVVIFVDDAHAADASSWEALGYLSRNIPDTRVLFLAAARSAELSENEAATDVLLGLEQEGQLVRLELAPLDRDAVAELAGAVLGDRPPDHLVGWLVERSRGNPLFALGLLHALIEESADLAAPKLRALPEEIARRVEVRVRGLDEPELATLEALAALGRGMGLRDLVGLTGLPIDRLPRTLDRLVRLRLVIETELGRELSYEVAHPLIEEAIYRNIGGSRRRALHRLIGRSLVAQGRLGEAAPHFARSAQFGEREAIDAVRDAIRRAEERGTYREALTLLGTLVDLIPAGDERWRDVLDALHWRAEWVVDHRADAHAVLGIRAMQAIDAILERSGNPEGRAIVKFRLANFLGWGTGEVDEAEAVCTQARSLFEEARDRAGVLLTENELAWIRGLRGDYAAMEAAARCVAEAADTANERFAAIQGLQATGFAALVRGRFTSAERAFLSSNEIARQEGKVYRLTIGLGNLSVMRAAEGRIDEAAALFEEAKAVNPDWRESLLPEWEAIVHWFAGDFPGALASAQDAAARAVGELSKRRALGVVFAALSAVETGRMDDARGYLRAARDAFGGRDWQFFSHMCGHAEGLLAWQEGRPSESIPSLRRAADAVLSTGARVFAALVLVDLAELAAESGDGGASAHAKRELDSIALGIDRPLFHGLAAMASASCGDAEAARLAVRLLQATGCKAFHARALDILGRSLLGTDRRAAIETLERAATAFTTSGAVWRADRVRATLRGVGARARASATAGLGPAALSRREWQVARLAAQGRTAREIAAELFISERTVESHIANVYAKLGVRSKTELIRRASELALNR
jgi:DNA-binding NarL/FixJ family response regulator